MPALFLSGKDRIPLYELHIQMKTTREQKYPSHKRYRRFRALLLFGVALLASCNNMGSMDFPGVYKIGIAQGNIITQEMVDQLRPGMSKRQVVFVMGTPLVRDPYHQDRWDYIYNFQPGGGVRGQERISVFFIDDELVKFSGDFAPKDSVVPIDSMVPIQGINDS